MADTLTAPAGGSGSPLLPFLQQPSRCLVFWGQGAADIHFSADGRLLDFPAALHEALQASGVQRAAFSAPHKPLFFLDAESEALSQPQGVDALEQTAPSVPRMRYLSQGPLQDLMVLPLQTEAIMPSLDAPSMGDVHALRALDAILRSADLPSAAVFLQAEAGLRYFEDPRTLAGVAGEWFRLPPHNLNRLIFVFSAAERAQLEELSQTLPIPELRSLLQRPDDPALIALQQPDPSSLAAMLRHLHNFEGIDWVEEEVPRLVDWMAAEGGACRLWYARWQSAGSIDLATARQSGWFRAILHPDLPAAARLQNLVGLTGIKERLLELSGWLTVQQQRLPNRTHPPEAPLLHMVFSGSPGTGKTTLARLLGELYHDIGILRRGHLVEVKASDLVAEHVGGSAQKTRRVVESALDGVLFIDEAYTLAEKERGGFGSEALDTLLTFLEDERSRLVVVLAGYPQAMDRLLQSNPGLSRRFPQENRFVFPDFSPEELSDILLQMLAQRHLTLSEGMEQTLRALIDNLHRKRDEHFGNAGEMRSLADGMERRWAARLHRLGMALDEPLTEEDIPPAYRACLPGLLPPLSECMSALNALIGLDTVKDSISSLVDAIRLEQLRKPTADSSALLQHLVFYGSPGTGKTTVARLMGKIYHSLGLLRKGHLVEVSRSDLVAGYVGQSALKTMQKVKEALDGVLFIDEAYALLDPPHAPGFGREALDTLVKAMEDHRSRLLVILAGYTVEMAALMAQNPGLASRFAEPLEFADYSSDELAQILERMAADEGFSLTPGALNAAREALEAQRTLLGQRFGNARAVRSLLQQARRLHGRRVMKQVDGGEDLPADVSTLTEEDIPQSSLPLPLQQPAPRRGVNPWQTIETRTAAKGQGFPISKS